MILYIINSKISIDLSNFKHLDLKPTKVYVIKIRNHYFYGFILSKYPYLNKKVIKIRNLNIVDGIELKFFEGIFETFDLVIDKICKFGDFLAKYFYSGFEKIIKTFVNYEDILRISINGIIAEDSVYKILEKSKLGKDIEIKYVNHDYLENKTKMVFKIADFKSDKIKKIIKKIRQNFRKRISYFFDYHIYLKENYFLKFYGSLRIIYDLEKVYKKNKGLNPQILGSNFWKDNEIIFLGSQSFIFPLWGIVFGKFFDTIKIDYFPYFSYFLPFLIKMDGKVDFDSCLSLMNSEVKKEIIEIFRAVKNKLVFENFSVKNIKDLVKKGNSILFYSFYRSFYKIYCRYCGNVPFCEICSNRLKVYPRFLGKEGKVDQAKLFCPKCKIKYDLFNCQYCGKFDWDIWKKDYKEILGDLDVVFIDFLPSNFSYYLDTSKEYITIIDYFSLNKPFILKELNIWYILEKLVKQVPLKSIIFINCEEFDVFEYFSQFFEDEEILVQKLRELLTLERRLIDKI